MFNDDNLEWELPHDPGSTDNELVPVGIDLVPGTPTYEQIREQLAARIRDLLMHDFNGLTAILYRLDVPESEAAVAMRIKDPLISATALADAVLRREIRKREQRRNAGSG